MSNVVISKKRLEQLESIEEKMNALDAAGVDNWEGYDIALEEIHNKYRIDQITEKLVKDIEECIINDVHEPSERGAGYDTSDIARHLSEEMVRNFLIQLKEEELI